MRVPIADLDRLHEPLREELTVAFSRVVGHSRFIQGPEVEAFERELSASLGVPRVVSVSSGTDALIVSLMALGVGPGDEVITPAFSFIATAEAIARVGATPIFADIDASYNLDPASALDRRGPRTAAIVFVDTFGQRLDPAGLAPAGVSLIEDAAHAIGAPGVGRGVRAATFSFFPTKNLGALGDGGAVLTEDEGLAEAVAMLRSHGSRPKYVHHRIGGTMRLDALQAALLRVKLPHLERWNARRRAVAARYHAELAEVPGLTLPADAPGHVFHHFVVRALPTDGGEVSARRDALRAHLSERGVETEVYYPCPLHLQPCFAALGGRRGSLPVTEDACSSALALPVHPALSALEVSHVIEAIRSFSR